MTWRRTLFSRSAGVALAALALTAAPVLPAGADPAPPPAAAPDDATHVRGVLERTVTEADGHGTDGVTTWLRVGDDHVAVASPDLTGLPTGTALEADLGPAAGDGVRPATRVTVVARPAARAQVQARTEAHSVTVLLALPAGARADRTTPAAVAKAVAGASAYWSRVSGRRFTFSVARTIGWTKLSGSCDDVWGLWDQARRRAGFTPGARRHLMVYVPPGAGCPTGLGTIGDSTVAGGYTFVGGVSVSLAAHELGHNLGLGHSDALSCAGAADGVRPASGWGSRCRHVGYGDWYDVMGISWENLGSLSTFQAYRLGLLPATDVVSVRGPARVPLRPVSDPSGVRSLRITDPSGAIYVVEYRPAAGADAWLGTAANWRGLDAGVLVRRVDPEDPTQSLLLDPTPGRTASADPDWHEALGAGDSLTTGSGRVVITVAATGDFGASVTVSVDGASPTVVVTPAGPLAAGAQVTIGTALTTWAALSS